MTTPITDIINHKSGLYYIIVFDNEVIKDFINYITK